MRPIGNSLATLVIILLAVGANIASAAVTASVDRSRVALGDTLRLTIIATADEDIDEGQLRGLQQDFDILQRSNSSNTSIVNGRVSQSRKLLVDLAPRREGVLQIPAMQFGQSTTAALTVTVTPASDTPGDGQSVVFEAEVDHDNVYVQGQLVLTLRVQQSVNLEGRSITPLKLDNAFVKPLEQQSYQRVINGQPWLVDEIRYAIFPEQSGTLEIPAQVFSGRVDRGRRSFFDLGGGGELVRRSTRPITITVLPKPADYPSSEWLPAERLTLEESWSSPPEELQVGESATRTVRIVGDGLQGAQLPPILFTPPDGLKYYPDQPSISEQEVSGGLEGIREDSAAVVPTRAGTYVIPEIRIPWWDTQAETVRYATLPQREITATGTAPTVNTAVTGPADSVTAIPGPSSGIAVDTVSAGDTVAGPPTGLLVWQALGVASTLGWCLTLLYVWRTRSPKPEKATVGDTLSEKTSFDAVIKACEQDNSSATRAALLAWAATAAPGNMIRSLEQVTDAMGDEELGQRLRELDTALYRPGEADWTGKALAACLRRVRSETSSSRKRAVDAGVRLYPSAS